MAERFTTQLAGRGPNNAWVFLPIPFNVEGVFGTKARVAVTGTINGFPFRNSLLPEGDGTHAIPINKELQAGANVRSGDTVDVVIERDTTERVVDIPHELEAQLTSAPAARAFLESLSYSNRKEYADWVGSAKQEPTRLQRAEKAVQFLLDGKKKLR
jgi:hypothetical protein